jgi:molybdopterin converting factor small subunit
MLNDQEAVTLRQQQLSTSIGQLQEQLQQMVASNQRDGVRSGPPAADQAALKQLEERISAMQSQIQGWLDTRGRNQRQVQTNESESWAYLLSLLSAIQDRVGQLSVERTNASVGLHARALLEELEQEMQQLRGISEDIATLQWRLRRSLHERETNISSLRTRTNGAN